MNGKLRIAFAMVAVTLLVATSISYAQQKSVRIRGTIEKVEGQNLEVKSREGKDLKVRMAEKVRFTAMVRASLKDLTPDAYIGVTAMPQADGSQRAIAIHIFQPKQRGLAEGHRPWDLKPGSTMTNAAIATTVASTDGQVLTVRYKEKSGSGTGEQKMIVTPQTMIVRYVPGDRAELKPGVRVMLNNAKPMPDGTIEAPTVSYGRDGVVPPM
ncbi:MAG: hypothetical protein GEU95_08030 [Rhizobiales bacterium]|nr:hypothetical protein [Hyphomicrobiales bacterium]